MNAPGPRPLPLAPLALLAATAALSPACRREPPAPAPGTPGARAWSEVDLPRPAYSPVERLRAKTRAGNDRFLVEVLDEEIEARLGRLAAFLRRPEPARDDQLDDLLAEDFSSGPLRPRETAVLHDAPGIRVTAGNPRGPTAGRHEFARLARRAIEPLEELDRTELKVVGIEGARAGPAARVLFVFAGAETGGRRHQFRGEARITFDRHRRLAHWETLWWQHARVDTPPFADVTGELLRGTGSWRSLASRPVDHFRARLDAASGIDVYGHHGLAVGDADGDGREDLYVAMPAGVPNLLYRARGDSTFEDRGAASGTDVLDGTSAALFFDTDNDGDQDLFLVTDAGLQVLLGQRDGPFVPAPGGPLGHTADLSTPVAAAAADYDLDGLVDVYVASYVFWRGRKGDAGTRLPIPYHEVHNGAPNVLLRNRGGGRFEDVTEAARLGAGNDRFSFAASWGDYDADGDPDLYVANDFGSNNLYRNRGDGTFEDVAAEAGVLDVGPGMSAAWEDYDADGLLDLYVGNMFTAAGRRVTGWQGYKGEHPEVRRLLQRHARGNSLFRNRGDGTFEDASLASGAHFGRWAWASDFIDFNLDGLPDIYVQNGFITGPEVHDL